MELIKNNNQSLFTLSKDELCEAIGNYIQESYRIPEPCVGALSLRAGGKENSKLAVDGIIALIDIPMEEVEVIKCRCTGLSHRYDCPEHEICF